MKEEVLVPRPTFDCFAKFTKRLAEQLGESRVITLEDYQTVAQVLSQETRKKRLTIQFTFPEQAPPSFDKADIAGVIAKIETPGERSFVIVPIPSGIRVTFPSGESREYSPICLNNLRDLFPEYFDPRYPFAAFNPSDFEDWLCSGLYIAELDPPTKISNTKAFGEVGDKPLPPPSVLSLLFILTTALNKQARVSRRRTYTYSDALTKSTRLPSCIFWCNKNRRAGIANTTFPSESHRYGPEICFTAMTSLLPNEKCANFIYGYRIVWRPIINF